VPIWGTLDVAPLLKAAPDVTELAQEPVVYEGAEVLQLMYEIDVYEDLLPKALHPTLPPTATIIFWKTHEFTAAMLRVGCRAGIRPRGFVTGAFVDDADAARMLASRWGLRSDIADVRLERTYHRIDATVPGVLSCASVDPEPISGGDLLYVANMHLARVGGAPRLVQVDPEYAFHKVDRGRPEVTTFDAAALGEPRVNLVYPMSASWTQCDLTLPRVRYICDPDVPALQGTEKIG
jgi:hypothetical protein